ncbi:uncharacterized, partial [Tachysurus ichikawai]
MRIKLAPQMQSDPVLETAKRSNVLICFSPALFSGAPALQPCWLRAREQASVPQGSRHLPGLHLSLHLHNHHHHQLQHVQLGLPPQPGELQQRAEPLSDPLSTVHLQPCTPSI